MTRGALRADLAELKVDLAELKLELLTKLASSARVDNLETTYHELARTVISREVVKQIISESLRDAEARGWTSRERTMAVTLFMLTIGSFLLNLYALN